MTLFDSLVKVGHDQSRMFFLRVEYQAGTAESLSKAFCIFIVAADDLASAMEPLRRLLIGICACVCWAGPLERERLLLRPLPERLAAEAFWRVGTCMESMIEDESFPCLAALSCVARVYLSSSISILRLPEWRITPMRAVWSDSISPRLASKRCKSSLILAFWALSCSFSCLERFNCSAS